MTRFLIDTNVISELTKPKPDQNVIKFMDGLSEVWISTLTLHELDYGILRLPDGRRKTQLKDIIEQIIHSYGDCILPINRSEALSAAQLRVYASQSGRILDLADSLIAGTAKEQKLTIATRNVSDFTGLKLQLVNPWN